MPVRNQQTQPKAVDAPKPPVRNARTRTRHHAADDGEHAKTDPVLRRIQRYQTAFPAADIEGVASHIAVVNTGLLMQQAVTRHLGTNFDINPARYSLLRALYFAPERKLPQNQVAREMGTSPPNVTQLLDALERDGLVERVINKENRRITYARLTDEGIAKCDVLVPAMVSFMEKSMAGLSNDEKQQLRILLLKLRGDLARMLAPGI